jgi:dTDP-D-glucose 4,6-dehydratase
MRTIPRTAGAGSIGATVVNYLREKYPEDVVLDILTYAGSVENLPEDLLQGQHPLRRFWHGDVCNGGAGGHAGRGV